MHRASPQPTHWGVCGERGCVRAWQKQPCKPLCEPCGSCKPCEGAEAGAGADVGGGGFSRFEMSVWRACTAGLTTTCGDECCW